MTLAIAVLGVLVLAFGVLGIARPRALMALVERPWRTRTGLYLAVALRALVGVLLLAGAARTRFPWIVGAIGVLSLAAALSLPVLGHERPRKQVDWWMARPDGFVRGWSVAACLFGVFLVFAAV